MEKQFELMGDYVKPDNTAFGQFKHTVAQKLSDAANALHQQSARTEQPSEFSRLGQKAAGWLECSADYVNAMEPQKLKDDLAMQVRRNPGRSLLIVGAAGLILGKLLRRR
ncbi:MAG: hypothetical protein HOP19_19930 [Acidobacteria bacterium]|nr:hypothetical protein [Acidobacteriota bacterium]